MINWRRWYINRIQPGLDVPWDAAPRRGTFDRFLWKKAVNQKGDGWNLPERKLVQFLIGFAVAFIVLGAILVIVDYLV